MQNYFLAFYFGLKRNLASIYMIASTIMVIIAFAALHQAYQFQKKPILIAIDQNGARVITRNDDPIYRSEAASFIRFYVGKLYNFDITTFNENVGIATKLMTQELWKTEEEKVQKVADQVEKEQISFQTEVLKITENANGSYDAILLLTQKSRISTAKRKILLTIDLEKRERTQMNPYGLYVANYKEQIVAE